MIATLQKHRTFLIVVLGLTVVAFIGSSAVGWGSYGYGPKAGAIATVGEEKISIEQYARTYGQWREFYNSALDQPLNAAMESELKKQALNSLIQEALFVSFARDVGLRVSDEEISELIVTDPRFQNDGVFDKNVYLAYLRNARVEVRTFESQLERRALIAKLDATLKLPVSQSERETIAASRFGVDRLTYKIINAPTKISVTEKEALAYYESNTLQFMGEPNYDLSFIKVLAADQNASQEEALNYYERSKSDFLNDEGEIRAFEDVKAEALFAAKLAKARRLAVAARNDWRDGLKEPSRVKGVEFRNAVLPIDVMQSLENSQSLEIAGPFEIAGGFAFAKIDERRAAEPAPFKKAQSAVEAELKRQKLAEYLRSESEKQLRNFKGETTGFVSRDDADKIKGLSETEAETFLARVFDSKDREGAVELGQRAVVYRVLEQKLFDPSKLEENDERLSLEVSQLKVGQIRRSLLETLQSRYTITVYQQGL
jgi:peptidyl-prolyl cis-trans isomerase D